MPRGRKKSLSLDEQLETMNAEIANMENSLKEMKNAKKELEEQIHQNKLAELDRLITESGKSFEDIREMLEKE